MCACMNWKLMFLFIDRPSKPRNCVTNNSNDSFKISCEPGSDGGLKQYFILEIRLANSTQDDVTNEVSEHHLNDQAFDVHTMKMNKPFHKMQKESPVFDVYTLGSGLPYIFILYAINLKGKSEPVIITQEQSVRSKSIVSSEIKSLDTLTVPPVYIAIMVLILLIASLVIMTAIVLACRSHNVPRAENVDELNNFRIAYSDVDDKRVSNYESEF